VHSPSRIPHRHLVVENATAGRHPLDIPPTQHAAVPETVGMLDRTGQDIGDRFDAAVGMPGKTGAIRCRIVVPEVIEQQEGIGLGGVAKAEGAPEVYPGPFDGGPGLGNASDGTNGHRILRLMMGMRSPATTAIGWTTRDRPPPSTYTPPRGNGKLAARGAVLHLPSTHAPFPD